MTKSDLREDAEKIRAELRHLEQVEHALEEARGEFEHELRRVGDALVRAGRSRDLDSRDRQLRDNVALNRKDLDKNRARRHTLEARLRDIVRVLDLDT